MELTLGRELDPYINPIALELDDFSNSLDSYQRLESYFKNQRQKYAISIHELEMRLQECNKVHAALSKSKDETYSRINQDSRSIDLERYGDLLHYSFKEIEWTKSSRIMTVADSKAIKNIQKYEKELLSYENKIGSIQKSFSSTFAQLKDTIDGSISTIKDKAASDHKQLNEAFDSIELQMQKLQGIFDDQLEELQKELASSKTDCISIISSRVAGLQQQMHELMHDSSSFN